MTKINKFLVIFISAFVLIMMAFTKITFAAGCINVSQTSIETNVNQTVYLQITSDNAYGKITVSSDGCATSNYDEVWIEPSEPLTAEVYIASEGEGNVYIYLDDVATGDGEDISGEMITIYVRGYASSPGDQTNNSAKYEDANAPEQPLVNTNEQIIEELTNTETAVNTSAKTATGKETLSIIQGNISYEISNIPVSKDIPEGFGEKEVEIEGKKVKALVAQFEGYEDFYYLYAKTGAKEGYYSYDSKDKTIQRVVEFPQPKEKEESKEKQTETVSKTVFFIALGVALAIIVVLVILLLTTKKKINQSFEDDY